MPKCKLCFIAKELLNSHAIPDSVFKKILRTNSGKAIVVPGGGEEPIHYSSDSWAESQLCSDCETTLNTEYEQYSLSVLRGSKGNFKRHAAGVTFSNIEVGRFISFFMSIFWRAANSGHSSYNKVFIPEPWNDKIRSSLLSNSSISRSLACVKIERLIDKTPKNGFSLEALKSMIITPYFKRYSYGRYSFSFAFEGFLIEIFMPGLPFKERSKQGILSKEKKVVFAPFRHIFDVPEIKEALVLGYEKVVNNEVTFES